MNQVEVVLPGALDHGFDYKVPAGMAVAIGDIVEVPLGRTQTLGIVWGEGIAKLDPAKLKAIARKHEFPPFSGAMREFIRWSAWYNCASLGAVLKMSLPVKDIDKLGKTAPLEQVPHTHLAKLSPAQSKAASTLTEKIQHGFSVTLLDGVTGSGKTEVYFEAIAEVLGIRHLGLGISEENDNPQCPMPNAQCLILLPEIALSVQWLRRFESRFGFKPYVWHSSITPTKKRAAWQAIAKGDARVVVGARSALFLPYKNLSLIVVDEEHDASYKQEDGVIYHARDMAVARARIEKLPVVLVSATPSLESYYNVQQKKYQEVSLPDRHNEAKLPDLEMIDMRTAPIERGAFISEPLRKALADTILNGHQAMLFLNRRGYAPLLLCRVCGHRFQCPECSAWMVVHRKGIRHKALGISEENLFANAQSLMPNPYLQCHHCDYHQPMPDTCPECGKQDLHACGPGVERVREEVESFLPTARLKVMASDQTDNTHDLTDIITAMENKQVDLLIGTQMIAKGHHFAGLALVGVVDADLGLAGGDLRAAERTYQLLHQLSGRAGREDVAGIVYLQSFLPEHPVMRALLSGERNNFLEAELQARENAQMPPFSRLAAIIVEGVREDLVMKCAKQLATITPSPHHSITLLGPAPAPLYRLRGKFRYRLLVKAERNVNLPDFVRGWLAACPIPSSIRIKTDIDPVSFL